MRTYVATVVSQILNQFGDVELTLSEQYLPVRASTQQLASIAAVRYFGDDDDVYHLDSVSDSEQQISHAEGCGHAIRFRALNVRFVCVRTVHVSDDEIPYFYSMTTGLTNGEPIQGE